MSWPSKDPRPGRPHPKWLGEREEESCSEPDTDQQGLGRGLTAPWRGPLPSHSWLFPFPRLCSGEAGRTQCAQAMPPP